MRSSASAARSATQTSRYDEHWPGCPALSRQRVPLTVRSQSAPQNTGVGISRPPPQVPSLRRAPTPRSAPPGSLRDAALCTCRRHRRSARRTAAAPFRISLRLRASLTRVPALLFVDPSPLPFRFPPMLAPVRFDGLELSSVLPSAVPKHSLVIVGHTRLAAAHVVELPSIGRRDIGNAHPGPPNPFELARPHAGANSTRTTRATGSTWRFSTSIRTLERAETIGNCRCSPLSRQSSMFFVYDSGFRSSNGAGLSSTSLCSIWSD